MKKLMTLSCLISCFLYGFNLLAQVKQTALRDTPFPIKGSYKELAEVFYPQNILGQRLLSIVLEINKKQENGNDPFAGNNGPNNQGYNLNNVPMAFMFNIKKNKGDLLLLNWPNKPECSSVELVSQGSSYLKKTKSKDLFIYRDISISSINNQDLQDQYLIFSFLNSHLNTLYSGSNPNYLAKDHCLRKSLDLISANVIIPDANRVDELFAKTGYKKLSEQKIEDLYSLLIIHEAYHLLDIPADRHTKPELTAYSEIESDHSDEDSLWKSYTEAYYFLTHQISLLEIKNKLNDKQLVLLQKY